MQEALPHRAAALRLTKRQICDEKEGSSPGRSDLEVVGMHARLFDDDHLAAFVNSPSALLPWNGNQNLVIDRYDVRHLLVDLSGIRKRRALPLVDVTIEELDYERYRDLEDLENDNPASDEETTGYYHNAPFSYTAHAEDGGRLLESGHGSMDFCPPFPVPESLISKLPPSQKVHQIIAGTAKFVSEHGGQSEIILKVKQGDNPMFSFLNSDHRLHEYFRYLVSHPELVGAIVKTNVTSAESLKNTGEGLSLLGSVYGSGDDEDDDSGAAASASPEGAKRSSEGIMQEGKVGIQGMQEVEFPSCKTMEQVISAEGSPSGLSGVVYIPSDPEMEVASKRLDVTENSHPVLDVSKSVEQLSAVDVLPPSTKATTTEPPLQLKLIIDKMVEFIARNGKEFESVVKDRAKTDGRFQFLLPWNEHHAYYLQRLEAAQKERELNGGFLQVKQVVHTPEEYETSITLNTISEKGIASLAYDSLTASSQPLSGERRSNNVGISCGNTGASVAQDSSNTGRQKMRIVIGRKDVNQQVEKRFCMGAEAATAVRTTTGKAEFKAREDGKILNIPECHRREDGGMSVDAAAAVVMAATRGGRRHRQDHLDDKMASVASLHEGFSRALESSFGTGSGGLDTGAGAGASNSSKQSILSSSRQHETDIATAKAIARAAALAAAHEADSADARLTPAEKLKAERLRRAKMFSAMIKSGQSIPGSNSEVGGSMPGTSAHVSVHGISDAAVNGNIQDKVFVSERKGVDLIISRRHLESDYHDEQLKKQRSHCDNGGDEDHSSCKIKNSCLVTDKGVEEMWKERSHHTCRSRPNRKKYRDDDDVASEQDKDTNQRKSYGADEHGNKECRRKSHRHSHAESKVHHKRKKLHDERDSEGWEKKHVHKQKTHSDGHHFHKRDERPEGHNRIRTADCLSDEESNKLENNSKTYKQKGISNSMSSCQNEPQPLERNKTTDKVGSFGVVERKVDLALDSAATTLLADDIPDDLRAKVRLMLLSNLK